MSIQAKGLVEIYEINNGVKSKVYEGNNIINKTGSPWPSPQRKTANEPPATGTSNFSVGNDMALVCLSQRDWATYI